MRGSNLIFFTMCFNTILFSFFLPNIMHEMEMVMEMAICDMMLVMVTAERHPQKYARQQAHLLYYVLQYHFVQPPLTKHYANPSIALAQSHPRPKVYQQFLLHCKGNHIHY